jgi:quercetin dioxygenase-like cupin family protein
MFWKKNGEDYSVVAEGIGRKTLVHGERTLMTEFLLAEGANILLHSHPEEQTGYLVAGLMRLSIGSESREMFTGDNWAIPAVVEHRLAILEDSMALEVFSTIRMDFLETPGRTE